MSHQVSELTEQFKVVYERVCLCIILIRFPILFIRWIAVSEWTLYVKIEINLHFLIQSSHHKILRWLSVFFFFNFLLSKFLIGMSMNVTYASSFRLLPMGVYIFLRLMTGEESKKQFDFFHFFSLSFETFFFTLQAKWGDLLTKETQKQQPFEFYWLHGVTDQETFSIID